jgi:hypothetical protein
MPVLDTERRSGTRSALRYRPINTDHARPSPVVSHAQRSRSDVHVTATPTVPDDLDLEEEELVPRRRSVSAKTSAPAPRAHARRHFHPLFFVGIGIIAMILLWTGITQLLAWGANEYNTLVYGYPRTMQVDAVVGQGDSAQRPSHFVAINFHGTIVILDFLAGDPQKMREFEITPSLGPMSNLDPVMLRFVDVDHNGKPDMLVNVGGVQSVLVNDQGTFRQPTPAELQQILGILQQSGQ